MLSVSSRGWQHSYPVYANMRKSGNTLQAHARVVQLSQELNNLAVAGWRSKLVSATVGVDIPRPHCKYKLTLKAIWVDMLRLRLRAFVQEKKRDGERERGGHRI